jgi:hypothetical protein
MADIHDRINVILGITEEIYEYYKIKASRNGTDIDTQFILTLVENMNAEQYTKEIPTSNSSSSR